MGVNSAKTIVFDPDAHRWPVLLGFNQYGHLADWALAGPEQVMGRSGASPQTDIEVPSPLVSARHGKFSSDAEGIFFEDLGSSNGSCINGRPCSGRTLLKDGDVISVAPRQSPEEPLLKLVFTYSNAKFYWRELVLSDDVDEITIGRGEGSVALTDETVSRRHVSFLLRGSALYAFDLNSTNGIIIDGQKVQNSAIVPRMGVIKMGGTWGYYVGETLWIGSNCAVEETKVPPAESAVAVEPTASAAPVSSAAPEFVVQTEPLRGERALASGLPVLHIDIKKREVGGFRSRRVLLKDITLDIGSGEFVLVLGGSGAGKSTFFKAVMGYDEAEGSILYGDIDIYDEYDRIKYEIGYVPQENLVRPEASVWDTMVSAAAMKMPAGTSRHEHEERAQAILSKLGIEGVSQNLVGKISGGQLRRVCIGLELVGDPSLLFLDEPDSGLDEPVACSIRRDLRAVADTGKIVLAITHSPDIEADLFTLVVVIAKCSDGSGHLLFSGTPDQARAFFEVKRLSDIVGRINSKEENGEGLADTYLEKWEATHNG